MNKPWYFFAAAAVICAGPLFTAASAGAADNVKIGVIYPLTGNAATAGNSAKDAVELGARDRQRRASRTKGLPLADRRPAQSRRRQDRADQRRSSGQSAVGQNQTLRLIAQDKVVAMLGAYHSSVALTATAAAERQGIPFLVADSVALNITQRGFKWTFRVGPIAPDFAKAYTTFLNELKKAGRKINSIGDREREHRLRHLGRGERARSRQGRPTSRSRRKSPTTPTRPTCRRRCCSSRTRSPTR